MTWLFLVFTIVFVWYILRKAFLKSETRREVLSELFPEHDLPVLEEINLFEGMSIKLYGMKYKDEENEVFDDSSWEYHRLVNIINKHIEIDFIEGADGLEAEIQLADFRSDELKHEYIEIIGIVTNFNLGQYLFKGEEQFALLHEDSEIINKMKDHADEIISIMFVETVSRLNELSENNLFEDFEG